MALLPVTITLLPVSLRLVRIPRDCLHQHTHGLHRQLLRPGPIAFLSITANEIECSLFAEDKAALEDFAVDREPNVKRGRDGAAAADVAAAEDGATDSISEVADRELEVEISSDLWRVLQIDSHEDEDDGVGSSGTRVRELSAPLAEAGISILYQSSYMCDFIFVRAYRMDEVMALLIKAGFGFLSADEDVLTSETTSPLFSPVDAVDTASLLELDGSSGNRLSRALALAAVGRRSRSGTETSSLSSLYQLSGGLPPKVPDPVEVSEAPPFTTLQPPPMMERTDSDTPEPSPCQRASPAVTPRKPSLSPASATVDVLPPNLACIGLPISDSPSGDAESSWALKIIKLISYPDLIPVSAPSPVVPFFSFTRTPEGASLLASTSYLRALSFLLPGSIDSDADGDDEDDELMKCLQIDLQRFGLDRHGLVNRFSEVLEAAGINHMYASTYRTANLLVGRRHAQSAKALLRAC